MKRAPRWTVTVGGLAALVLGVLLGLSPYRSHDGFPHALIRESVDVTEPCERVHAYLGDSDNAREWSVFVDHITALNPDSVPDGAVGSIRRSFKNADESGMRWDETIVDVTPTRRLLTVYGITDSPAPSGELLTEQIYEPLGGSGCRLRFTLFLRDAPSLGDALLMRLGGWEVSRIFRANIANVKALVEGSSQGAAPVEAS
ncbi:MAG TPA: SRPBCC family protein [Longimicrobiales bacterium]|nr:SRPBCC family protein [Longimicrobiales bacterium]